MKTAIHAIAAAAVAAVAVPALAQAPTPPKLAIEAPNYVSIPMEIAVNKPAAEVWKRIGKYCDIGEWLQIPGGCKMISGVEGEVRFINLFGVGKRAIGLDPAPVFRGGARVRKQVGCHRRRL